MNNGHFLLHLKAKVTLPEVVKVVVIVCSPTLQFFTIAFLLKNARAYTVLFTFTWLNK